MKKLFIAGVILLGAYLFYIPFHGDTIQGEKIGKVSVFDDALGEAVGIETLGGVFTALITQETAVPAIVENSFSTAQNNQQIVSLRLFVGNNPLVEENRSLGELQISGFGMRSAGEPSIVVKITVDDEGGIWVGATEIGQHLDVSLLE